MARRSTGFSGGATGLDVVQKETAENVDHYKRGILDVGYSVAIAYGEAKKGGGAARISDKETQMIAKIAELLKATHLLEAAKADALAHAPKK